jgi:hypothetical protein
MLRAGAPAAVADEPKIEAPRVLAKPWKRTRIWFH